MYQILFGILICLVYGLAWACYYQMSKQEIQRAYYTQKDKKKIIQRIASEFAICSIIVLMIIFIFYKI